MLNFRLFVRWEIQQHLTAIQAYTDALGIKNVSWAPSSQFVAIGSYDCKTRILNQLTCAFSLHISFAISLSSARWRPIRDYEHEQEVSHKQALVYLESDLSGSRS